VLDPPTRTIRISVPSSRARFFAGLVDVYPIHGSQEFDDRRLSSA
jgi:hypothetical protein